jgi:hypothetical protein
MQDYPFIDADVYVYDVQLCLAGPCSGRRVHVWL